MTEGIVLAAGFSSRAKTNKMILMVEEKELILHTIATMHSVCEKIIVVTGHYHKDLVSLLAVYDYITIVFNENYHSGMFSSIKKGVSITCQDFFIIPGDAPTVKKETYFEILAAKKKIVVPSYNMRLGHPIFFAKEFKDKILNTSFTNLKDFRNAQDFHILETQDPGILLDIDNINDYNNLIRKD
ncbi:MAG: NTP transferase domain-containing protein [Tenericutes bacterium]|nr:NTP transferase domain-containing protein [Mycoplasmatota bacterium]